MPIAARACSTEGIAIKWWRSFRRSSPAGNRERREGDDVSAAAPPAGPAVPSPPTPGARTPEADKLFDRIAEATVRYRMTVPAILFLESVKPLSFVGSQALYFFEPMVRAVFTVPDYERFAALMERRENLEALLVAIE